LFTVSGTNTKKELTVVVKSRLRRLNINMILVGSDVAATMSVEGVRQVGRSRKTCWDVVCAKRLHTSGTDVDGRSRLQQAEPGLPESSHMCMCMCLCVM